MIARASKPAARLVALILLLAAATARAEVRYSVTNLGSRSFDRPSHEYYGINDSGQLIGHFRPKFAYFASIVVADGVNPPDPDIYFRRNSNDGLIGPKIELGWLNGLRVRPNAINSRGWTAGYRAGLGADHRAFVSSEDEENGFVVDLGTLGGSQSEATDINDLGLVVGWSNYESDKVDDTNASSDELYSFPDAGDAIIDLDALVLPGDRHAFFSNGSALPGSMIDLGTLGGDESEALAINNRAQVVGWANTNDGSARAFLSDGTGLPGSMVDLGTFGGASAATDINDSGQVVGWSYTNPDYSFDNPFPYDGPRRAFLSDGSGLPGSMIDLGTFGGEKSEAVAINNSGQIVGWTETEDGTKHAFLTNAASPNTLIDLNGYLTPRELEQWRLEKPIAINNAGQILTEARYIGGCFLYGVCTRHYTLLLTPTTSPFSLDWQNPDGAVDVNGDGAVSPLDALLVINDLNRNAPHELAIPRREADVRFLDVSGDGFVSPVDALIVLNRLNRPPAEAVSPNPVPEPGTWIGALLGLLALVAWRRRGLRSQQGIMIS